LLLYDPFLDQWNFNINEYKEKKEVRVDKVQKMLSSVRTKRDAEAQHKVQNQLRNAGSNIMGGPSAPLTAQNQNLDRSYFSNTSAAGGAGGFNSGPYATNNSFAGGYAT
jgi:hypothetical protein